MAEQGSEGMGCGDVVWLEDGEWYSHVFGVRLG